VKMCHPSQPWVVVVVVMIAAKAEVEVEEGGMRVMRVSVVVTAVSIMRSFMKLVLPLVSVLVKQQEVVGKGGVEEWYPTRLLLLLFLKNLLYYQMQHHPLAHLLLYLKNLQNFLYPRKYPLM
jgi:hypothetical protein